MAKGEINVNAQSISLYDDFLAEASLDRLQKILARYELMKMVSEVPGDIVECGVFKGSGIYTLSKIAKLLTPHTGRKIVGFDFFGEKRNTSFKRKADKQVLDFHDKDLADKDRILQNLAKQNIKNVE